MKLVWFCGLQERIYPFWGAIINKERYLVKYLGNIGSVSTILDPSGSKNNVLKMAVVSITTLLKTFSTVLNRSITDMARYGFHFFKNQVPKFLWSVSTIFEWFILEITHRKKSSMLKLCWPSHITSQRTPHAQVLFISAYLESFL